MSDGNITYRYVAQDSKGNKVKGTVSAPSDARAYAQVKSLGLQPIDVTGLKGGLNTEIKVPFAKRKPNPKSMALFSKQFGTLIRSGMPLIRALKVSAENTEDKRLQKALREVYDDVESGASLAASMERQPEVFSPLVTSIVKVGESGGFLDKAFLSIADSMKSEVRLKAQIKSAMIYPIVVGVIALLAVIAMLLFVIPIFVDMFEQMDAELPFITQALVTASENSIWAIPLITFIVLVLMFIYNKNKDRPKIRLFIDTYKLKIPVFGKLFTKVSLARFSKNLAMMVSSGVGIIESLTLVAGTMNNYAMELAIGEIIRAMKKGRAMSDPMTEQFGHLFPSMMTAMIAVGEESGALAPMLETVSEFYEEEVQDASERLSQALEPIMIVVIGVVVGGMLMSMYLPMFSMFDQMAAQ